MLNVVCWYHESLSKKHVSIYLINLQGFKKILSGEMDHLPEIAFYMVGPIEEVVQKAERLAESQKE